MYMREHAYPMANYLQSTSLRKNDHFFENLMVVVGDGRKSRVHGSISRVRVGRGSNSNLISFQL